MLKTIGKLRNLLIIGLLSGSTIAAIFLLTSWQRRQLAEYWTTRIERLEDSEARAALSEAISLGNEGIPVLVTAMGSYRWVVAQHAMFLLDEEIDRWESLSGDQSSPKLLILAQSLEKEVPRFGPVASGRAAELAIRLLHWPVDSKTIDTTKLTLHCENVLALTVDQRTGPAPPLSSVLQPFETEIGPPPKLRVASQTETIPTETDLISSGELPGGGLPIVGVDVPAIPRGTLPPVTSPHTEPVEPNILPDAEGDPENYVQHDLDRGRKDPPLRLFKPPRMKRIPKRSDDSPRESDSDRQRNDQKQREHAQAEKPHIIRLIWKLNAPDRFAQTIAAQELERLGFQQRDLEIARKLSSDDPQVRRRLVDELLQMQNTDAKPWLIWLSHDPDSNVRYAALSLMATAHDPDFQRRFQQVLQTDREQRILKLARTALQQQRR